MKDIKDIEKLTQDELEAISDNPGIAAADTGAKELVTKLELAEEAEERSPRKISFRWISSIAASVLLILGIGLALQDRGPEDTFDDPALAYSQVQEVFRQIGTGVRQGKDAVEQSEQRVSEEIEKTINIIR